MAGLTEGTAIVTPAEVGEITHEPSLANLDDDASATVTNAAKWTTSWLIDELDARGIPVAQIANPERLKRAAAFYTAFRVLHGGPDDEDAKKRAEDYLAEATRLVKQYRFVSSATSGPETNLILPTVENQDACSQFGSIPPWGRNPGAGPFPL